MKHIFLPADVNECEVLGNVCGEAICENHEGSYLCLCPDETQEFDRNSGKCFSTPPGNVVYCKSQCDQPIHYLIEIQILPTNSALTQNYKATNMPQITFYLDRWPLSSYKTSLPCTWNDSEALHVLISAIEIL